ncbi:hypothetical protein K3495_g2820 [Podosphaera aphanis]|nr:hypothetical protein K3495_g2820 [Podosphaera aphanis]
MQAYLLESKFSDESSEDQCQAVFDFIDHRESIRLVVNERSVARKEKAKERYDRGVRSCDKPYRLGDLVMLYDDAVAKQKLHESYRGPFRVSGFGSNRGHSYTLEQLDGREIKRKFHGDQLRLFILRTGHLITGEEAALLSYQNIRASRSKRRQISSEIPL